MNRAEQIGPLLPALRRHARALTGSQASGDTYVRVMLEALIVEPDQWDMDLPPRVAAYKLFHTVWSAVGQEIPAPPPMPEGPVAVADERLASLTPRSRQALLLTAMENLTLSEAAQVLQTDEDGVNELIEHANAEIAALTRARILVIEDEPIIALDIAGLVEDLGHVVTSVCATRTEAVVAAEAEKPDLVLADIQLADGSSGIDAAADILGRFAVPIIFITAFPDRLLTGRKVEPTFLITKPFQAASVRAAVSQALFFKSHARKIS